MLGSREVLLLRPRWHPLHYSARRRYLAGARSAAAAAPGPARALPRRRHDAAARPHAARAVLAAAVPRRRCSVSLWRALQAAGCAVHSGYCAAEPRRAQRTPNGRLRCGCGARPKSPILTARLSEHPGAASSRPVPQPSVALRAATRRRSSAARRNVVDSRTGRVSAHRRTPGRFIAPARQVAVSRTI